MIIINKVILMGRLTKDVVINTTGAKPVGKFTIAVNRDFKNKDGKQDADFINCVAFDKRAEVISQYVKKGQQIILTGSWRTGSYDKDGVKVFTNELFVDGFEFIGGQVSNNANTTENNTNEVEDNTFGEPVDYGAMPF